MTKKTRDTGTETWDTQTAMSEYQQSDTIRPADQLTLAALCRAEIRENELIAEYQKEVAAGYYEFNRNNKNRAARHHMAAQLFLAGAVQCQQIADELRSTLGLSQSEKAQNPPPPAALPLVHRGVGEGDAGLSDDADASDRRMRNLAAAGASHS